MLWRNILPAFPKQSHILNTVYLTTLSAAQADQYTGCHRRNGPNFGRVFLMLNYTDIIQNTYIQS